MSPKTNTTAIVAVVAGILGFCFWGFGGLIAVVLGIVALREIERSGGRERGKGLSIAAIALGGSSLALLVLGFGVLIALFARPEPARPSTRLPPRTSLAPTLPPTHPPLARRPNTSPAPAEPRENVIGRVRIVDVGGESVSLTRVLQEQRRATRASGEKLVAFVVAPNCAPCRDVARALSDQRMQAALDHVRLVRVDATAHATELLHLGVPLDAVPGFALLSDALRPIDYVHGGEWDADVPENIAPVLGAFVRGEYHRRRHPYRGPTRRDETPL